MKTEYYLYQNTIGIHTFEVLRKIDLQRAEQICHAAESRNHHEWTNLSDPIEWAPGMRIRMRLAESIGNLFVIINPTILILGDTREETNYFDILNFTGQYPERVQQCFLSAWQGIDCEWTLDTFALTRADLCMNILTEFSIPEFLALLRKTPYCPKYEKNCYTDDEKADQRQFKISVSDQALTVYNKTEQEQACYQNYAVTETILRVELQMYARRIHCWMGIDLKDIAVTETLAWLSKMAPTILPYEVGRIISRGEYRPLESYNFAIRTEFGMHSAVKERLFRILQTYAAAVDAYAARKALIEDLGYSQYRAAMKQFAIWNLAPVPLEQHSAAARIPGLPNIVQTLCDSYNMNKR